MPYVYEYAEQTVIFLINRIIDDELNIYNFIIKNECHRNSFIIHLMKQ